MVPMEDRRKPAGAGIGGPATPAANPAYTPDQQDAARDNRAKLMKTMKPTPTISTAGAVAPIPKPTPLPPMQMPDFSAMFQGAGGGGAGGGGGGGGGGGEAGPGDISTFKGSPSTWMEEVYRRQLEQADNAPDMYDSYITQARDATTGAMREVQQGLMGRLGAGASSPAAASRISDMAARNMNAATAAAAKDKFGMVQSALGGAQTAGSGVSSDLRAQENSGINAYRATSDANIARARLSLEGQIASINAMLGFYTPWMQMMGNMYGSAAGAGGVSGGGAYGGSSGYTGTRLG